MLEEEMKRLMNKLKQDNKIALSQNSFGEMLMRNNKEKNINHLERCYLNTSLNDY